MEINDFLNNVVDACDVFTDKRLLKHLKEDSLSTCSQEEKLALKLVGEKGAGEIIFLFLMLHDRIRELENIISAENKIKNNA